MGIIFDHSPVQTRIAFSLNAALCRGLALNWAASDPVKPLVLSSLAGVTPWGSYEGAYLKLPPNAKFSSPAPLGLIKNEYSFAHTRPKGDMSVPSSYQCSKSTRYQVGSRHAMGLPLPFYVSEGGLFSWEDPIASWTKIEPKEKCLCFPAEYGFFNCTSPSSSSGTVHMHWFGAKKLVFKRSFRSVFARGFTRYICQRCSHIGVTGCINVDRTLTRQNDCPTTNSHELTL